MVKGNGNKRKFICVSCGKTFPLDELSNRNICARCIGLSVIAGGKKSTRWKKTEATNYEIKEE